MARKEHPSEAHLHSVIYMLKRHGSKLTPELVREITDNAQSALEILRMAGDPLAERSAFILLMLRQATAIKVFKHGKEKEDEYVETLDGDLYRIGMKMLHNLP